MPELTLLQRARQGDPTAIAILINRQLQPKGLSASVQQNGTVLQIDITAKQIPSRKLTDYLQAAFQKLQPQGIDQVQISVQQAAAAIAWSDTLHLSHPEAIAAPSPTPSKPPSDRHSAKSPNGSSVWNGLNFWANWIAANIGATLIMAILVAIPIGVVIAVTNQADFLGNWLNPRQTGQRSLGAPTIFLQFFMFFAVFGLIIGDAQTAILRRWLTGMGWWRLATAFGVPLSLLVGDVCYGIMQVMLPQDGLLSLLAWCVSLMLGSATLALCQWVVLGRRITGFWIWLMGNVFSVPLAIAMTAVLGTIIGQRVASVLLPGGSRDNQEIIIAMTVLLLLWLSIHGVIGTVLAWLLRNRLPITTQS
jgi:hypothetical protein